MMVPRDDHGIQAEGKVWHVFALAGSGNSPSQAGGRHVFLAVPAAGGQAGGSEIPRTMCLSTGVDRGRAMREEPDHQEGVLPPAPSVPLVRGSTGVQPGGLHAH